ncbi:MAG: YraN family protein [Candidatus Yonathbacteria bacterium]|nr:YraN family protein [Candidatus Yonathbacteria bacterium]
MRKYTQKQEIGRLGEDLAVKYLENKGFTILSRNYLKKYGEIDIVAQKGKIIHFIEVKSVSHETLSNNVSCVTDNYRPEDNVHPQKLKRLTRTIQAYLLEKYQESEPEWVFDLITVVIVLVNKKARVRFLENIIL